MDGPKAWLEENILSRIQESTALTIITTLLAVLITTRFVTGGSSKLSNGKTPVLAPYWAPFLGHVPQALIGINSLLSGLRYKYAEGLFSIRLSRRIHTILYKPSITEDLLKQPSTVADEKHVLRHLMLTTFGLRKRDLAAYDAVAAEIQAEDKLNLSGDDLRTLTESTLSQLKSNVADFVTFNTFPVDQMDWERIADSEFKEDNGKGEPAMESNLLELVRNFVARTANAAIFGTDFVENFPEIWSNLWSFNEDFTTLAMEIPMWFPSRSRQRGRNSLNKMHGYLVEFHAALELEMNEQDVEPKWEDLDNVSQLIKSRAQVYRKHNLPLEARAACDLSLLWSLNANSTPLVFWALFELYQDPVLLSQVRDEIAPYVHIIQPDNEFGLAVWVPPKVENLDVEGLLEKCPTFRAAYTESVRLYGGGWAARYIREDVTLSEGHVLKKGTYAHVVQDLWHMDRRSFDDPKEWRLARHIEEANEKDAQKRTFKSPIKPYDGGLAMCNDSELAIRKVLAYTAVLASFYDVEPANGGKWSMLTTVNGVVSKAPLWPGKVWIKRRQFPKVHRELLV